MTALFILTDSAELLSFYVDFYSDFVKGNVFAGHLYCRFSGFYNASAVCLIITSNNKLGCDLYHFIPISFL